MESLYKLFANDHKIYLKLVKLGDILVTKTSFVFFYFVIKYKKNKIKMKI